MKFYDVSLYTFWPEILAIDKSTSKISQDVSMVTNYGSVRYNLLRSSIYLIFLNWFLLTIRRGSL